MYRTLQSARWLLAGNQLFVHPEGYATICLTT